MGGFRFFLLLPLVAFVACQYQPTWDSLDARPLPAWYDNVKFGIFIHWGVFSVPSFGSEWFWWYWQGSKDPHYVNFMNSNYPPGFTYADFASQFTAEMFDPAQWAQILAGAKYVVLTSKHHEGFTNWPSNYSWNWNAGTVGPRRDLVGDLANAIRNSTDMHFGLYHSMFEWFNPLYLRDAANNFTTTDFVDHKTMPELYEIVNKYKPEIVWSDGDAGPDTYWKSKEFLAWLYNESPVKDIVVVNDRWGDGDACKHGGYYTCDDRFTPGKLMDRKWENCMTIDRASWGFRRDAVLSDYIPTHELVGTLAQTVAFGGNLLMNIGPTHDGRIDPIFEERLSQMGSWLSVNGDGIYGTSPWKLQNDTYYSEVWYTSKGDYVYAIVMNWPDSDYLDLASPQPTQSTTVNLLGYGTNLQWAKRAEGGIRVFVSQVPVETMLDYAWVFRLYKVMPNGKHRG